MHRNLLLASLLVLTSVVPCRSQDAAAPPNEALAKSVEELRQARGQWAVTTDFLKEDGSVARTVQQTYRFDWVLEDRILSGRTETPELGQVSGILFWVNERKGQIQMASVGKDGHLFVMSGPLGGDTRATEPFPSGDGKQARYRFVRSNVQPDSFESRMEWTEDDGKTWLPANRQVFRRVQ